MASAEGASEVESDVGAGSIELVEGAVQHPRLLHSELGEADAEELTARLDQRRRVANESGADAVRDAGESRDAAPGELGVVQGAKGELEAAELQLHQQPAARSCAAALSLAPLRLSVPVWCSSLSRITYTFLSRDARASW